MAKFIFSIWYTNYLPAESKKIGDFMHLSYVGLAKLEVHFEFCGEEDKIKIQVSFPDII